MRYLFHALDWRLMIVVTHRQDISHGNLCDEKYHTDYAQEVDGNCKVTPPGTGLLHVSFTIFLFFLFRLILI